MNATRSCQSIAFTAVILLSVAAHAEDAPLPTVDGRPVVAEVNGEPVMLDDLAAQIAAAHMGFAEPTAKVSRRDPSQLLDRLIGIRLILQEARVPVQAIAPQVEQTYAEGTRAGLSRPAQRPDRLDGDPAGLPRSSTAPTSWS